MAGDESQPLRDIGLPYNRSKIMGEQIAQDYYEKYDLPLTIVRPVSIYGPRDLNYVTEITRLLQQRLMIEVNGGRSHAGLLYVQNAVQGIIAAARSASTVGHAYNLRDSHDATWNDFANRLAAGLGTAKPWINVPEGLIMKVAQLFEFLYDRLKLPGRPLVTRHTVFLFSHDQGYGIAKARRDFGYEPTVDFATGMSQTIDWLLSAEGQAAIAS